MPTPKKCDIENSIFWGPKMDGCRENCSILKFKDITKGPTNNFWPEILIGSFKSRDTLKIYK